MPLPRWVAPAETERRQASPQLHPGNWALRRAILENIVSFPSQVPVLSKQSRPDIQWRVVTLYLVQGWTMNDIAARFGMAMSRVSLMIHEWSVRAFALGYIQVIDAERFAAMVGDESSERAMERAEPLPAPVAAARVQNISAARPAPLNAALNAPSPNGAHDNVLVCLDLAISQCEARQGEFWDHAVAALRSFRLAAESIGHPAPSYTAVQELALPSTHNPVKTPVHEFAGVA
jgi:hypothetical protein